MELRAPGHTAIDSVIQNAKELAQCQRVQSGLPREGER